MYECIKVFPKSCLAKGSHELLCPIGIDLDDIADQVWSIKCIVIEFNTYLRLYYVIGFTRVLPVFVCVPTEHFNSISLFELIYDFFVYLFVSVLYMCFCIPFCTCFIYVLLYPILFVFYKRAFVYLFVCVIYACFCIPFCMCLIYG